MYVVAEATTMAGGDSRPITGRRPEQCLGFSRPGPITERKPDRCLGLSRPSVGRGPRTNVGAEACTSGGREPKPMSEQRLAPVTAGNPNQCRNVSLPQWRQGTQTSLSPSLSSPLSPTARVLCMGVLRPAPPIPLDRPGEGSRSLARTTLGRPTPSP